MSDFDAQLNAFWFEKMGESFDDFVKRTVSGSYRPTIRRDVFGIWADFLAAEWKRRVVRLGGTPRDAYVV